MARKIIHRVMGIPIFWDGKVIEFTAPHTVDADGARNCYHPNGSPPGLDRLANAGHPGNWWALATHNQKTSGRPVIQSSSDPAPGFYVSMTAYTLPGFAYSNPRRYLDSNVIPFTVIPHALLEKVKPMFKGCQCEAFNEQTGDMALSVLGDIGPDDHLGEGSMQHARLLSLNPDPKRGGTSRPIIHWRIYPGVPAHINGKTYPLQSAA